MSFDGPYFALNLRDGAIALVGACLFMTALWWIQHRRDTRPNEATMREQEAKLEEERKKKHARDVVNAMLPLSSRPARRLAMHQERHPK